MACTSRFCSAILLVVSASACGGGARGVRPAAPTYAEATGATCTPGEATTPFIVDLPPDQRGEVESAMRHGSVLVAYDCKQLTVLTDCKVGGEYMYEGLTTREQVISINDQDEMRANLPLRGAFIAAQLGVDFERSRTLDVALAIVGKKSGAMRHVMRADLKGACRGATHYIRSAQVGAFAMQTGARGQAKAAVEIFGAGLSGKSASSMRILNRDGSLEACRSSSSSSDDEKAGCSAPLRVQLDPILERPLPPSESLADAADEEVALACPSGMRPNDAGKCVRPSSQAAYVCSPKDARECELQCQRGSMGSCAILGRSYQIGRGVKADAQQAISLLTSACKGGATPACGRLGEMLLAVREHAQKGLELLNQSCKEGWFRACTIAAEHLKSSGAIGNKKVDVFELFRRGCAGGDPDGCWSVGHLFELGLGAPKNDVESVRYYKLACDGGARLGCGDYARLLAEGRGGSADVPAAIAVLERACDRGYSYSCSQLARNHMTGNGVNKDWAKGVSLLERACEGNDRAQCVTVGMGYEFGQGVPKDRSKALRYYNRACEAGIELACPRAAALGGQ